VRSVRWLDRDTVLACGTWGKGAGELREIAVATGVARSLTPPLFVNDAQDALTLAVGADGRLVAYDVNEKRGDIWLVELTSKKPSR
jgi:hypothetical protein